MQKLFIYFSTLLLSGILARSLWALTALSFGAEWWPFVNGEGLNALEEVLYVEGGGGLNEDEGGLKAEDEELNVEVGGLKDEKEAIANGEKLL